MCYYAHKTEGIRHETHVTSAKYSTSKPVETLCQSKTQVHRSNSLNIDIVVTKKKLNKQVFSRAIEEAIQNPFECFFNRIRTNNIRFPNKTKKKRVYD